MTSTWSINSYTLSTSSSLSGKITQSLANHLSNCGGGKPQYQRNQSSLPSRSKKGRSWLIPTVCLCLQSSPSMPTVRLCLQSVYAYSPSMPPPVLWMTPLMALVWIGTALANLITPSEGTCFSTYSFLGRYLSRPVVVDAILASSTTSVWNKATPLPIKENISRQQTAYAHGSVIGQLSILTSWINQTHDVIVTSMTIPQN